jgi:hypothetical protein
MRQMTTLCLLKKKESEAIRFAEKALRLWPKDYVLLKDYARVLSSAQTYGGDDYCFESLCMYGERCFV